MDDPLVLLWAIRRPPITPKEWRRVLERPFRWYRFPHFIDIWHREPKGSDSGSVCRNRRRRRWHLHHWHLRVWPAYNLRKWLFVRCEECGRGQRYGAAWHGYMSSDRVWHSECMSLGRLRHERLITCEVLDRLFEFYGITDEQMLRSIVVHSDERRDQFLLWYRPWRWVQDYRASDERWRAPNEHLAAPAAAGGRP